MSTSPNRSNWSSSSDWSMSTSSPTAMRSQKNLHKGSGLQRVPISFDFQFSSTSPPDITANTRVLAVCGISNKKAFHSSGGEIDKLSGRASPTKCGWFFSDFFLLHWLISGQGAAAERWMTCVEPLELGQQYKEYLHGNPYEERKIVFDERLFKTRRYDNISVSDSERLLPDFLAALKDECVAARALNQQLVVILLGHGDYRSKGVFLGGRDSRHIMTPEAFSNAAGAKDIQICLMSMACYSGGWTMMPDVLNITAITAASKENESESWQRSESIGRCCGSIFLSALITTSDQAYLLEQESKTAFHDYAKTVIDVCVNNTDRLYNHGLCFSSQDDRWEIEYRARTGITLGMFRYRWSFLEDKKPQYGDPSSNRDALRYNPDGSFRAVNTPGVLGYQQSEEMYRQHNPINLLDDDDETLRGMSGSLRGRFGMSGPEKILENFRGFVSDRADFYLQCLPGKSNIANNQDVEGDIWNLRNGTKMDYIALDHILTQIEYRMRLMEHANRLALFLNPKHTRRIQDEDMDKWVQKRSGDPAFRYAREEITKHEIFGKPTEEQGTEFLKPSIYLAACMSSWGGNKERIDRAISKLIKCTEIAIKERNDLVSGSGLVMEKKRKWTETVSKFMGRMSPKRRRGGAGCQ